MTKSTSKIFWFTTNEINVRSPLINSDKVHKIFHLKKFFYLIQKNYFEEELNKNIDIFSDHFKSSEGLSPKLTPVSTVFKKIKNERHGLLIESHTFGKPEFMLSIMEKNETTIFFKSCIISSPSRKHRVIAFHNVKESLRCYWNDCSFSHAQISLRPPFNNDQLTIITNSFVNCTFDRLDYFVGNNSKLILENNTIDILVTKSDFVRLKNVTLKLFHHTNLDNSKNDFGFDNVKIDFDKKILKKIRDYEILGYINTLKNLLDNKSLYSERKNIFIYLSYFSSRTPKLKQLLFFFNKGYYGIVFPLILTLVLVMIKMGILWVFRDKLFTGEPSFIPIMYPIEMYKNIIFSYLSMSPSIIKIGLFIIEPIYIYSMFSFLTGVKRFLGFKLDL